MRSIGASSGAPSAVSRNTAAKPAAPSSALRSRSGTSSASARRNTISRLGCDRPVSMNERWRDETPDSVASRSWLVPRRARHSRKSRPNGLGEPARGAAMPQTSARGASHSRAPNPLPRRELVRGSARRTTIAAPKEKQR